MSAFINKAKEAMNSEKHHSTHTTTTTTDAGPHDSNLANKVGSRVDSDMDHRADPMSRVGGPGTHSGTNGTTGSTNVGSHNSNVRNEKDPRVDSDADHRNKPTSMMGSSNSGYSTATTGTTHGSTTAGPQSSNVLNKADPQVDSNMDRRANPNSNVSDTAYLGTTGSSITGTKRSVTPGSGAAKDTAGPHNSNLLNKLDPRIDSDLDGSKTMGGNATNK